MGKVKSAVVATALNLQFIDAPQAKEADIHVRELPGYVPEIECLVACGFIQKDEADIVLETLRKANPEAYVLEMVRSKRRAIKGLERTLVRVERAARLYQQ